MNQTRSGHFFLRLPWRKSTGFTLVEMAVVVTLMAIFLTMGLRMVQATRDNAAWSETKAKQERIKLALIGYLRSYGTLPCPDATATGTPPTGLKGTAPCLGNLGRGVLPWKDLGLSLADVQDGWSNFFTYHVANRTPASSSNWTIKTGVGAFSIKELTAPLVTFSLRERNAAGVLSATALSPNPVVIILSHGKNGSGAKTIGGTFNAAPTAADELVNATTASTAFITRIPTDVAASAGGIFDDLVAYMTPQDLLQPLMTEGTLRACASYCPAATSGSTTTSTSTAYCKKNGTGTLSPGNGSCSCPGPATVTASTNCASNENHFCSACTTGGTTSAPALPCNTTGVIPVGAYPVVCE